MKRRMGGNTPLGEEIRVLRRETNRLGKTWRRKIGVPNIGRTGVEKTVEKSENEETTRKAGRNGRIQ